MLGMSNKANKGGRVKSGMQRKKKSNKKEAETFRPYQYSELPGAALWCLMIPGSVLPIKTAGPSKQVLLNSSYIIAYNDFPIIMQQVCI